MHSRSAVAAGALYPAHPDELLAQLSALLAAAPEGARPKALIVPHAALSLSGAVAAAAFKRLQGVHLERVVLLGPPHFEALQGLALPEASTFETPLGAVRVELPQLPHTARSAAHHAREHSLELAVPFLQATLRGQFSLIPLLVGDASAGQVAEVLRALWGGQETLFVISSDLSHYLPAGRAHELDNVTVKEILRLGEVAPHQACGARAINGLLAVARREPPMHAELLDLRNSGDDGGEERFVVGYAAFAFYEPA